MRSNSRRIWAECSRWPAKAVSPHRLYWPGAALTMALLLAACAGPHRAASQTSQPGGTTPDQEVRTALAVTGRAAARATLTVNQSISPAMGASGSGRVDYRKQTSHFILNVKGGGETEFLQTGQQLLLRSYNNPAQQRQSSWIKLNVSRLPRLLTWPPYGLGDPAFVFVSASLMQILQNNFTTASKIEPKNNTQIAGTDVFRIWLSSFGAQPWKNSHGGNRPSSSPTPVMTFWIDASHRIRQITLLWPASVNSEVSSRPKGSPSPATGNGNITVAIRFSDFQR